MAMGDWKLGPVDCLPHVRIPGRETKEKELNATENKTATGPCETVWIRTVNRARKTNVK
jgi:hypothetical protein